MILHDHGSGGKRKASLVREKRETMAFLQNGGQPFAVSAEQASGTKEPSPKVYGSCSQRWTTGNGFTLQGMAACGGYLTFGNDSNLFYVIHQ